MKSFCLAFSFTALLIVLSQVCIAQDVREIRFISSFVYNSDVFNYEYRLTPNDVSALKFEKITNKETLTSEKLKLELEEIRKLLTGKAEDWKSNQDSVFKADSLISKAEEQILASNNFLVSAKEMILLAREVLRATKEGLTIPDTAKLEENRIIIDGIITRLDLLASYVSSVTHLDKEVLIGDFTLNVVRDVVEDKITPYYPNSDKKSEQLDELARKIFYEVAARKTFVNDRPSTAFLRLVASSINGYIKDVPVKRTNKDPTKNVPIELELVDAEIEFHAGTIKNIEAKFRVKEESGYKELDFRNNIPISVSNKFAPEDFKSHSIYASNTGSINRNVLVKANIGTDLTLDEDKHKSEDYQIYFNLADLIKYDIILNNYTEDYSPEDGTVIISPQQSVVELRKQSRSKIITVKAFTDINGFDSEEPNGLVQFEADVSVNLLTNRSQSLLSFSMNKVYEGLLTRATLRGYLSKIEENQKHLVLSLSDAVPLNVTGNQKQFNISPLELYRHRNSGIDLRVNIYKVNFPKIMSNIQIDGAYGIFRTAVADSLSIENNTYQTMATRNEKLVNSINYQLSAIMEFVPESRFGLQIGLSKTWIKTRDPEILKLGGPESQIWTLSSEASYWLNDEHSSQLFFRWKHHSLNSDPTYNFNQIQTGVIVDIFKAK